MLVLDHYFFLRSTFMRTVKKLILRLFLIFSIIVISSCDNGSSGSKNDSVGWIDITGAESLMLVSDSASSGRSSADGNPLYKITEDGVVVEATITDEDGGEYTSEFWPNGIFNIDDDYVMITFGYNYGTFGNGEDAEYAYLTRKSDGAVFEIPDRYIPQPNGEGDPENAIQFFLSGQFIYYLSYGVINYDSYSRIVRLDISNPSLLTAEGWSPETDFVYGFTADRDGNIAYDAVLNDEGLDDKYRLKYHGGRLTNTDESSIWTGTDGSLYRAEETETYGEYNYNRIDFDSDGYPSEETMCTASKAGSRFPISLNTIQYFVGSSITEINYTDKSVTSYNTGIEVKDYAASEDFFYLLGDNGNILRFEPGTGDTTNILSSDYDVYSFSVSSDNCVEFNALRMTDGKKVIGRIENADTLTTEATPDILDTSMDSEVVSLVRIK